jgi:hypothetical protein
MDEVLRVFHVVQATIPHRCFARLCFLAPSMLTVDLKGTPFLYISGHPYCGSILKQYGCNFWVISSRKQDLLRRLIILNSTDSVLASFVNVGSSFLGSHESPLLLFLLCCAETVLAQWHMLIWNVSLIICYVLTLGVIGNILWRWKYVNWECILFCLLLVNELARCLIICYTTCLQCLYVVSTVHMLGSIRDMLWSQ